MTHTERCVKCGKPRLQCRCKVCECAVPIEEEADGEVEIVEIPEVEKPNAHKRKEKNHEKNGNE